MAIVILDGYPLAGEGNSWAGLEPYGQVEIFDRSSPEEVLARSENAEILITNKAPIGADAIAKAPQLQFIALTATGYDCVDTQAARKRGIPVSNVPEYSTDSVAQFVFALLLHVCHHVGKHVEAVQAGEWSRCPDFCFWKTPLLELAGRTMGLVGFGRIGRRVGELAHAFGMNVLAFSRSRAIPPEYRPFSWVELDELAQRADVISLHCPLTAATAGLVNRGFLARLKPKAILINTARGGLIVEQDLVEALRDGRLHAAALDVASEEPLPPDSPLLTAPNCVVTPHIAWATIAARQRLVEATVANVANFINGRPTNVVNP